MILRLLLAAALATLLATACGGGDTAEPTPAPETPTSAARPAPTEAPPDTTTPTETATRPSRAPASSESLDHDIENAMEHVGVLAVAIGPRVSGSREARETVAYISETFRSYGYAVEVMDFDYATRFRPATVTVDGETIAGIALNGAATGEQSVEGPAHGVLSPEGASLRGAISVRERSTTTPSDRQDYVAAVSGDAAGLVIVNDPRWPPFGFPIEVRDAIPVVLVPHTEAHRFERAVAEGATITVAIGPARPPAANVIARPGEGARCEILAGGHHDTVPSAAGAIDNASGVAVVLELARAFAADGLDEGLCFATFGAEESGLFGSLELVRRWGAAEQLPRLMVNFDVTARGEAVELIGSPELVQQALALLERHDIPAFPSSLPSNTGSDHMSFAWAGVPVLMFSDGDLSLIHTPDDVFDQVDPVALDRIGDAAAIVMATLLAEIAGGP